MSTTVHRYIEMLRNIPLTPRKIGSADLRQKLAAAGHQVTARTVERDLVALRDEANFPIETDGAKPAGWSWLENTRGFSAPAMSAADALSLDLLERFLHPLLPVAKSAVFQRMVQDARATLRSSGNAPLAHWRSNVAVVPENLPLQPPRIDRAVESILHEALLHQREFEVDYVAIGSGRKRRYRVHPHALVMQGPTVYVVALLDEFEDLRHLALHRMSNATSGVSAARSFEGFDLNSYLTTQSAFHIPTGGAVRLKIRTSEWMARHLTERKLSDDQVIKAEPSTEAMLVTATLPMSEQLVWWLRSHGPDVEVIAPVALRRRLRDEAIELANRYG